MLLDTTMQLRGLATAKTRTDGVKLLILLVITSARSGYVPYLQPIT